MITTLTGSNTFALQSQLSGLTKNFIAEHGDFTLERLDGETVNLDRITEALTSQPFLANKKMVVLRAPSANKQFVERAAQLFQEVPETTDTILIEPKLDKRLSFYKFLKEETIFKEFIELDRTGLSQWLSETAKREGGSLSLSDARYMVERVGANQLSLSNELNKLLLFSPNITHRTIDLLTEATPQSTVFQLLEAAFSGKTKRALDLYAEQRALKVEPQQIIAMISWQLHILAVIKSAGERKTEEIAKQAKLNPFVVQKSQAITRKLTKPQLKDLLQALLEIDIRSKRTPLDLDEALQHYLLMLAD